MIIHKGLNQLITATILLLSSCIQNNSKSQSVILSPRYIVMSDVSGKLYEGYSVLVKDSKIQEIDKSDILLSKYPRIKSIKTNSILSPGFINTHTHLANTHMRNNKNNTQKYKNIKKWFKVTLEKENLSSNKNIVYKSAIIGVAELLMSGVTYVNDMSFYANQVKLALHDMEFDGLVGETLINKKNIHYKRSSEALSILKRNLKSLSNVSISPLTINSIETGDLKEILSLSQKYRAIIHTHWGEFPANFSTETKSLLSQPFKQKLKLVVAHGVHIDPTLKIILRNHDVSVSLNISSNNFLNTGEIDLVFYKENKVNISIGTDSPITNHSMSIFDELRLIQKLDSFQLAHFTYKDLYSWATIGGAKALGLELEMGTIEVGKKANLISIAVPKDKNISKKQVYEYLIKQGDKGLINYVMINGNIKVTNGNLKSNINETLSIAKRELRKNQKILPKQPRHN